MPIHQAVLRNMTVLESCLSAADVGNEPGQLAGMAQALVRHVGR